MSMKWTPLASAAASAALASTAHAAVYYSVPQAQAAMFPGAHFQASPLQLSDEDRKALLAASGVHEPFDGSGVWRVSTGGWFITDAVVGKHEKIRYAVGIDATGKVVGIEILEYNETYGYQVRDASWRKQFVGKNARDPVKLNQDIRNVSGATLSCKHITDGVRRVLALHERRLRTP